MTKKITIDLIPVSQMLPEEGELVMLMGPFGTTCGKRRSDGWYDYLDVDRDGDAYPLEGIPTYWAPLPLEQ